MRGLMASVAVGLGLLALLPVSVQAQETVKIGLFHLSGPFAAAGRQLKVLKPLRR